MDLPQLPDSLLAIAAGLALASVVIAAIGLAAACVLLTPATRAPVISNQ